MTFRLNKGSPSGPFSFEAVLKPLVVLVMVVGYLQPFHSNPWPSAISDGIFVLCGFLLILFAWSSKEFRPIQFSCEELFTGLLLATSGLWFGIKSANRGIAPYVLLISIAYLCYKLTRNRKDILVLVMLGIATASLVTALIGIGQWLGIWDAFPGRFLWMIDRDAAKPLTGNLAQPNNAGSLLVWGLICCVALENKLLSSPIQAWLSHATAALTTFCVILISVAAALTQSRTASLELLLMAALVICFRRKCGPRVVTLLVMGVSVHVLIALCLPTIKSMLFDVETLGTFGGKGLTDGARLYAYPIFLKAIAAKPMLGYGLGGVTTAYLSNAPLTTGVGQYFGHTHNLILEVFVWFGIPLGGWLIYQFGTTLAKSVPSANSLLELATLAMVLSMLIHAMLELPLHYAYFLIPFSVLCAQLPHPKSKNLFQFPSRALFAAAAFLGALFVLLSIEYLRLEQDIRSARLQLALMGRTDPPSRERAHFLPELKNADGMLRIPVTEGMTPEQLQLFETTVRQFPQRVLIEKYSQALRVNGRPEEALQWFRLGCAIYRMNDCEIKANES